MQVAQIVHAHKQAPWRVKRQWIGAFLLAVIGLAMVAALYLDVTARSAVTGREIQELRLQITAVQQTNADLETRLADMTSTTAMEDRAKALGYRPVKPGELDYIAVTGFYVPEPEILLLADDIPIYDQTTPSEYTESLVEWFDKRVRFGGAR